MYKTFETLDMNDTELELINLLLVQSEKDRAAIIRACTYVINRIEQEETEMDLIDGLPRQIPL